MECKLKILKQLHCFIIKRKYINFWIWIYDVDSNSKSQKNLIKDKCLGATSSVSHNAIDKIIFKSKFNLWHFFTFYSLKQNN